MSEVHYIISDASKKLKVEPHVLRYWEDELKLEIPRNEMGHRHYTEENMKLLGQIKNLKEKGFQLKAIKLALPKIDQLDAMDDVTLYRIREELNQRVEERAAAAPAPAGIEVVKTGQEELSVDREARLLEFKTIMKGLITEALQENNRELSFAVSENLSDQVLKEMDYIIRDNEEKEEERFRQLDEAIRGMQKARQEVAITEMALDKKKKEKRRMFKKKR